MWAERLVWRRLRNVTQSGPSTNAYRWFYRNTAFVPTRYAGLFDTALKQQIVIHLPRVEFPLAPSPFERFQTLLAEAEQKRFRAATTFGSIVSYQGILGAQ
jgi:hypothetical protein